MIKVPFSEYQYRVVDDMLEYHEKIIQRRETDPDIRTGIERVMEDLHIISSLEDIHQISKDIVNEVVKMLDTIISNEIDAPEINSTLQCVYEITKGVYFDILFWIYGKNDMRKDRWEELSVNMLRVKVIKEEEL